MLPPEFSNQTYWDEIYWQPLSYWQDSLDRIAHQRFHESIQWERASLGRNIVFLSESWVIKLCPPGWKEDLPREMAALNFVAGQLPVRTPEVIHNGILDEWGYIIQRRLAGRNLHEIWKTLEPGQRKRIAFQHGEILSTLQALIIPDHPGRDALSFDWDAMLAEQNKECVIEMRNGGVNPILLGQVEDYISTHAGSIQNTPHEVLLHGDLTHLNFLANPVGENIQVTALIDWGDAKIGPPGHEFISPGVHMYLGDHDALACFYQGCGDALKTARNPAELMVRSMLYYARDFASILESTPELKLCRDWPSVEEQLWSV